MDLFRDLRFAARRVQTSAHDPLTLASISVLLAVVAIAACLARARRVTRLDPLIALRHE